jgi:hypothetical protein
VEVRSIDRPAAFGFRVGYGGRTDNLVADRAKFGVDLIELGPVIGTVSVGFGGARIVFSDGVSKGALIRTKPQQFLLIAAMVHAETKSDRSNEGDDQAGEVQ